jgi:hypothetical protein
LYLTPKVQDLYNHNNDLTATGQYLFETPIEDLLSKPIPTIKAWVHKKTLRMKMIKNRAKAKRREEKAKITQVHPFFTQKWQPIVPVKRNRRNLATTKRTLTSTTLTTFFPRIHKKQAPPVQNDLFPRDLFLQVY